MGRLTRFSASLLAALGLALMVNVPASAQTFEDGVSAYTSGDWKKAREIWEPIASDGDSVAMFNVGVLYEQGLGVPVDINKAVSLYRGAAERGYAPAQFNLGAAYKNGMGVPQSDAEAANWWQLAADQGEIQAQYNLGILYAKGLGVAKDDNTARYFFEQAARRGDKRAGQALAQLASGSSPASSVAVRKKVKTDTTDDDTVDPGDDSIVAVTTPEPAPEPEIVVVTADTTEPDPQPAVAVEAPQPARVVQAPAPQPAPAPAPEPEPVVMTGQLVSGADATWVANNDPGAYTIQIYASGDENAARKFISRYGLEDNAHVVPAVSGSKLWYKVAYGSFATSGDARTARSGLPVAVQKNSPWIRKFQALQQELAAETVTASSDSQVISASDNASSESVIISSDTTTVAAPVAAPAPEVVVVTEPDPQAQPVSTMSSTTIITGDTVRTVASDGTETVRSIGESTNSAESAPAPAPAPESIETSQTGYQSVVQPETVASTSAAAAQQTIAKVQSSGNAIPSAGNDDANPALKFAEGQRAFNQQDYATALNHWQPLAETGHAQSQYGLGFMHETGWGVPRDAGKALGWYKQAAEQGYAKAQYNLGMMYLLGNGVPEDEAMGLYWIQSAADQNDLRARAQLSRLRSGGS